MQSGCGSPELVDSDAESASLPMMQRPGRVLLVTERADLSADLLVVELSRRGVPFFRFNQEEFPSRVHACWHSSANQILIESASDGIEGAEIAFAWYRRYKGPDSSTEGYDATCTEFVTRESRGFLAGLWSIARWPWVNHPANVAEAEQKVLQLHRALELGMVVPDTLVGNHPQRVRNFLDTQEAVGKTIVGGSLVDGSRSLFVYTTPLESDDAKSSTSIAASPIIVQQRINGAKDVRVTIVDDEAFSVEIDVEGKGVHEVDWRLVPDERLCYSPRTLPASVAKLCIRLVRSFGLRYGALDLLRTVDGEYVFLELNPSGQWGWIERALELPITSRLVDLLAGTAHERRN